MRPFEGTMPLDEARAIIDRTIVPIERTERVRVLEKGLGSSHVRLPASSASAAGRW